MKVIVALHTPNTTPEKFPNRAALLVHLRSVLAEARSKFETAMKSIDPNVVLPEADGNELVPIITLNVSEEVYSILNDPLRRPEVVTGIDRMDAGNPADFELA